MSQVFVVDQSKQPRAPVHPALARRLLSSGQAAVWRRYPFTIILKEDGLSPEPPPLRLKLDPGSKTSGIALVDDASGRVVWAAELTHRGQQIRDALLARRAVRRNRRGRKTRYRRPRFLNRRRRAGWLAPSLESRVWNIETWVRRLRRLAPVSAVSMELVRFDTHLMQNAEISGVAYQQGELAGYEVREYLLEKWSRKCVYCGALGVPLQIEHITPRARGGSDRVSNFTLACEPCNTRKGTQTAAEFGYSHIQAQAKQPLKDTAAVNSTRWALYQRLSALGLPIEVGTGGRTKYNRIRLGLPKTHWLDAASVGVSTPDELHIEGVHPLLIRATGHGSRQMCRMDRYGFPRTAPKAARVVKGFQTGDLIRVVVSHGKKAGTYVGRVAVRATGSFNITTVNGTVQGISYRFCRLLHRSDGYTYLQEAALPPRG